MKFRTAIFAALVALILAIVGSTVAGVASILRASARRELTADLTRARLIFDEERSLRESLHRSESRVVAEEPRLKAVVATEDVNHDTVLSVAIELKKALESDLFFMTDAEARLVADVLDPKAEGSSLADQPLVRAARETGEARGILTTAGKAYECEAKRLAFGTEVVGVLVVGYVVGDDIAVAVAKQTGHDVIVALDGKVIAASKFDGHALPARADLEAAVAHVPVGASEPVEIDLAGETYLASARAFLSEGAAHPGAPSLTYVVLGSLDHVLAPASRVSGVVYGIGAAAFLAALGIAFVISTRLSRPIDGLVAFLGEVGKGKLAMRADVSGPREIQTLGTAMNDMVKELEVSRRELRTKERLERELEISAHIQTSILPQKIAIERLEVAARMKPASEVGGDYYDLIPIDGGAFIGVGDVAGHGLRSGLIMLMVQSSIAAVVRDRPDATPTEVIVAVNRAIYDNIRHRLGHDEHVTLTVLRTFADGRVTYAGAHEEMIVLRADTGKCELIPTPGTWIGAMEDVSRVTSDLTLELRPGDLLVLYTDGITEAMREDGTQLGIERLADIIEEHKAASCAAIVDRIFETTMAWSPVQADDMSVVALRYVP